MDDERIADGGFPMDRVFRVNAGCALFDTDMEPDGRIRINWSADGNTDRTAWDPDDFMIVPPASVTETILLLQMGFVHGIPVEEIER